jgi:hypothetical protein
MTTAFKVDWSKIINQPEEKSFDIYSNNKANPIRWLEHGYNQLDYGEYFTKEIWDKADAMQMEIMDNFSQWLHDNEWEINHTEATWFHYKNLNKDYKFSDVYQLFLKSREA